MKEFHRSGIRKNMPVEGDTTAAICRQNHWVEIISGGEVIEARIRNRKQGYSRVLLKSRNIILISLSARIVLRQS